MNNYLIDFNNLSWENPGRGIRYKEYIRGQKKIRLVELSEEFTEKEWCIKGHIGFILEGSLSIDFDGRVINFKTSDGLFIPEGNKHRASIARGVRALLIMFEGLFMNVE